MLRSLSSLRAQLRFLSESRGTTRGFFIEVKTGDFLPLQNTQRKEQKHTTITTALSRSLPLHTVHRTVLQSSAQVLLDCKHIQRNIEREVCKVLRVSLLTHCSRQLSQRYSREDPANSYQRREERLRHSSEAWSDPSEKKSNTGVEEKRQEKLSIRLCDVLN